MNNITSESELNSDFDRCEEKSFRTQPKALFRRLWSS